MLKKKTIKDFVKKRLQNAEDQMLQYCSTKDGECLHKLRVEIKKLNALIRLMNFCSGKKRQVAKKPLDKLFKSAGAIRTAFVHIELLKEHNIVADEFINGQQQIITEQTILFCNNTNIFKTLLQKARQKLFKKNRNIKTRLVKRFFKKQAQKIVAGFATPPTEEQLHDIRKKLKDLLYVFEMLPKKMQAMIMLDVDFVNELQDMIGQWHDAIAAKTVLQDAQISEGIEQIDKKQAELYSQVMIKAKNIKAGLFKKPQL